MFARLSATSPSLQHTRCHSLEPELSEQSIQVTVAMLPLLLLLWLCPPMSPEKVSFPTNRKRQGMQTVCDTALKSAKHALKSKASPPQMSAQNISKQNINSYMM